MDRAVCDGALGVQVDSQWMVILVGVQLVATAADKLHQWVSRREGDSIDLADLKRTIDQGNERSSQKMSEIQAKMLTVERDMIELQTLMGVNGRGNHRSAGV